MKKISSSENWYVDEACSMARQLLAKECRGPGDTIKAMRRIEARHGVPFSLLKALRYSPPTDLMMSGWLKLLNAYQTECERVERLVRLEQEKVRALQNATYQSLDRADLRSDPEEAA